MLLKTVLPCIINLLAVLLYSMCEVFFVSRLGSTALAAFSLVIPVTTAIMGLQYAFSSAAVTSTVSILQTGSQEELAQCSTLALAFSAIGSVLLSIVLLPLFPLIFSSLVSNPHIIQLATGYMDIWQLAFVLSACSFVITSIIRGYGNTWCSCCLNVGASAISLLLAPLLIFGTKNLPGLGVRGAAFTSAGTWLLTCFVGLCFLFKHKRLQCFTFFTIKQHLPFLCKQTGSVFIVNISQPVADSVLAGILATVSVQAVAAYGICMRVELLALLLVIAFRMAITPLARFHLETNILLVKRILKNSLILVACLELCIFLLCVLFAPSIAKAFSPTAETAQISQIYLTSVPLSYTALGVAQLTLSFLNAINFQSRALLLTGTRFVLMIGLAWLGMQANGVTGTFTGITISNWIAGITAVFILFRCFHRLTIEEAAPVPRVQPPQPTPQHSSRTSYGHHRQSPCAAGQPRAILSPDLPDHPQKPPQR